MIDGMKRAAARMWADYEASRSIGHAGEMGRENEASFVREWLGAYLPRRYSAINSGLVVSSSGELSRQQDVLVYDDFLSPRLLPGHGSQVVFCEATFCVMEVKSNLTKAGTSKAVQVVSSALSLQQSPVASLALGGNLGLQASKVPMFGAGFAYSSASTLEKAQEWLREAVGDTAERGWPSCLVILQDRKGRAGLVVCLDPNDLTHITTVPVTGARFGVVECESKGKALLFFFLILMKHLREAGVFAAGPDFMAYARTAGMEEPRIGVGLGELRGASAVVDSQRVDIDKALRAQELVSTALSQKSSDDDIVELIGLLADLPYGAYLRGSVARVFFNGQPADLPSYPDLLLALRAYIVNTSTPSQATAAQRFLALFRAAMSGQGTIEFK